MNLLLSRSTASNDPCIFRHNIWFKKRKQTCFYRKMSSFAGKRALVACCTRGIGVEIAKALNKKGTHVIIVSMNQTLLDEATIEMSGIETVCVDLADWKATDEAIKTVLPIHLLVNNAGISVARPFGQFEESDFDSVYSLNVKSVFNISQVVANDLKARKMPGSIVMLSSIASLRPQTDHAVYCSTKSAIDGLMAVMALELGPHQIRVNSINPTVTMTDMGKQHWGDPNKAGPMLSRTPLGRFADISDVVNAALFLLSDASSYLTGVVLPVDGGLTRA